MKIESDAAPFAGQDFRFTVRGGTGEKTVKAYLEYRCVLDKAFLGEAAETIAIPPQTGKFTLKILAHDSGGESAEMRYIISGDPAPEDQPGG